MEIVLELCLFTVKYIDPKSFSLAKLITLLSRILEYPLPRKFFLI